MPTAVCILQKKKGGFSNKNTESKKQCTRDPACFCADLCRTCHFNQYSQGGDTQCFECPKDKPYSFPGSASCTNNPYNVVCKEGEGLKQESVVYDREEGYCEAPLTEKQCEDLSRTNIADLTRVCRELAYGLHCG